MDNKKVSDGGGGSFFKSKYSEYRNQVKATKEFDSTLSKASTPKTSTPAPAAAKPEAQPSTQTNQAATQQAVLKGAADDMLPSGQLSPKITQFMSMIKASAARHGVPPELVAGIVWQESRANPQAKSYCGAQGLMQLMPQTAAGLGVTNAWDPAQNIEGGTKYIKQMLDRFGGKVEYAVAAYNSGPGNVTKYGGIPPFKETQNYVPNVLGYAANFKASGLFSESNTTMRA